MVDVETFLTVVYVLVDDVSKDVCPDQDTSPDRPRGPLPALSRSEVITLALCAHCLPFPSERAFYRYAVRHLRPLFPRLPDRSQFNRQLGRQVSAIVRVGLAVAGRLESVVGARQRRGAPCPYEVLDGMGVATRNLKRRGGGWLAQIATVGHSNRLGWYEGVYLLTAVTPQGTLTGFGVASAHCKDQVVADTFLAARHCCEPRLPEVGRSLAEDLYLGDSGFEGQAWHAQWAQRDGAVLLCPPKARDRRSRHPWTRAERRSFAGLRQIVETVHARLLDTFGLAHLRPHALSGLRAHLAAMVAALNVCCWLNLEGGRPLLAFADLLEW
ncbi:MAG TPA: transposase [Ktedonobacterales bacterium]|nr:transposase [Ktedonobacterales bacterium]